MGYAKKNLNGKYLSWYNTLSANKESIPSLPEYVAILDNINLLDWQGEEKESACRIINNVDETCKMLYTEILINIDKIKTCKNELFNELTKLNNKYIERNSYIDQYNAAYIEEYNRNNKKEDNNE